MFDNHKYQKDYHIINKDKQNEDSGGVGLFL